MRLLGISGSLTPTSRTVDVVLRVLDEAARIDPEVEPELLDLRDYEVAFCDGRPPAGYTGDTRLVIDQIRAADAYVVGTPAYRGSYTGALKNLFDLVPNDAPRGKVAGIVLTAGSDHHFLAVEHQLRPLLSFFQMHTVPGAVYAQNAHFRDGALVDETVFASCQEVAAGIVQLWRITSPEPLGLISPSIRRKVADLAR